MGADQDGNRQWVVEMGQEEACPDQVAAEHRVGFEDASDPIVVGPVWAKVTRAMEPTDRCLALAVVVSVSNSPAARAGEPLPAVMAKWTVCDSSVGVTPTRLDSELPSSNCPW